MTYTYINTNTISNSKYSFQIQIFQKYLHKVKQNTCATYVEKRLLCRRILVKRHFLTCITICVCGLLYVICAPTMDHGNIDSENMTRG